MTWCQAMALSVVSHIVSLTQALSEEGGMKCLRLYTGKTQSPWRLDHLVEHRPSSTTPYPQQTEDTMVEAEGVTKLTVPTYAQEQFPHSVTVWCRWGWLD